MKIDPQKSHTGSVFTNTAAIYFIDCSQDAQDVYMEQCREKELTKKILILQKTIRAWHCRRRFLKMKDSCITMQTTWRAYIARKRFLMVGVETSDKVLVEYIMFKSFLKTKLYSLILNV